jgi:hypothetical protein
MDRKARREAERLLAAVEHATGPARTFLDLEGPAIYQTEPSWRTAIVCVRCSYVALVVSLPRKPHLVWTCPRCEWMTSLRPPADVLEVPEPAHPRLATMRRSH